MKKKILVVGILGQDGHYLTKLLNNDFYEVVGICKENTDLLRINLFKKIFNIKILRIDLTNYDNVKKLISEENPDTIVNFGGVTNVFNPWENMEENFKQTCTLPINILEVLKNFNKDIFFFQSSSSLMYAGLKNEIVNENSKFSPIYPYGINKLYVHNLINEYRKTFGLNLCSGIFFNHESFYRNENFLSKKVSRFISEVLNGSKKKLILGGLESYKDISHAEDFMNGVKLIIDNNLNDNFIFSSGNKIKTFDFVNLFFKTYNLNMLDYVEVDDNHQRKETISIYGDNKKLISKGWDIKYSLTDLVKNMVENENIIY